VCSRAHNRSCRRRSSRYPRLGLPARAGFEVALADALEQRRDPLAALDLDTRW